MRHIGPLLGLAILVAVIAAWVVNRSAAPDAEPSPAGADLVATLAGTLAGEVTADEEPVPVRRHVSTSGEDDETNDTDVRERAVLVLDRAGLPIGGAIVRPGEDDDDGGNVAAETNAAGRASLPLPAYGDLVVSAPGHVTEAHEYDCDEDGEPIRVVVREGRRIEGVVVDSAGRPAVGARVSRGSDEPEDLVNVDDQGRFFFDGVDPDPTVWTDLHTERDGWLSPHVAANPGELDVRLVEYRPGAVNGVVVLPDGTAAVGATVRASASLSEARTDDAGRFELGEVLPGNATLRAISRVPGVQGVYLVGTTTRVVGEGGVTYGLRIVLGPDPERSIVRARVAGPGSYPTFSARGTSRSTTSQNPAVCRMSST